jgi:hypothetical protein
MFYYRFFKTCLKLAIKNLFNPSKRIIFPVPSLFLFSLFLFPNVYRSFWTEPQMCPQRFVGLEFMTTKITHLNFFFPIFQISRSVEILRKIFKKKVFVVFMLYPDTTKTFKVSMNNDVYKYIDLTFMIDKRSMSNNRIHVYACFKRGIGNFF